MSWKKEWFHSVAARNHGYWKEQKNQRKFFDDLAKKFQVTKPQHWGKIQVKRVAEHGGLALLNYYGGSLICALKSVYSGLKEEEDL